MQFRQSLQFHRVISNHWRHDVSRVNAVDPNLVATSASMQRSRFGEVTDCAFTCAICRVLRMANDAFNGRQINNRSTFFPQVLERMFYAEEAAIEVDCKLLGYIAWRKTEAIWNDGDALDQLRDALALILDKAS